MRTDRCELLGDLSYSEESAILIDSPTQTLSSRNVCPELERPASFMKSLTN